MRIGFWKEEITPPVGVELGGYAGYRPCTGIHDPLWCRAVLFEQEGRLYGLIVLDLMCADDRFCRMLYHALEPLGLRKENLLISAIHTHCAPCGAVPGEGLLEQISLPGYPRDATYGSYLEQVRNAVCSACRKAAHSMEAFSVRSGSCEAPPVGSQRHTGMNPHVQLTAVQCRTASGRSLILYHFPCHPTVMGPSNREVTADFTANIEGLLEADMAVFLNGAAGDISTRYTRRGQTFEECARLGKMAADAVLKVLQDRPYGPPKALRGIRGSFSMDVRPVEPVEKAQQRLQELTAQLHQAEAEGADPARLRLLRSYVEGAGVSLGFSRSLKGLDQICMDITAGEIFGIPFASVPGELFSTLLPDDGTCLLGYTNGYWLYIADKDAHDSGCYEAMASLFPRGEGERLMEYVKLLLRQLQE